MKGLNYLILVALIGCLVSCTQEVETTEALQEFITEHDLSKHKSIGAVTLQLRYKPNDLLVAQELRQQTPTTALLDSLRHKYGQYAYFLLSMSANDKEIEMWNTGTQGHFGERIQTLSFGMNQYVHLVTSQQDTIPITDYAYQRTFGMGRSTDILFAFDRTKIEESDWIQFQLKDFGLGIGNNRFKFETNDLKKVPALSFK